MEEEERPFLLDLPAAGAAGVVAAGSPPGSVEVRSEVGLGTRRRRKEGDFQEEDHWTSKWREEGRGCWLGMILIV